jgi:hypothetical protein
LQARATPVAILHVGGVSLDWQRPIVNADQRVTLATFDLFSFFFSFFFFLLSASEPRRPPPSAVSTLWMLMMAALGSTSRPTRS